MCGCSTTHQLRKITPSGFLDDYSQLQPGGKDQPQLLYVHPDLDLRQYTQFILDPVQIFAAENSKLTKLKPETVQSLADYLYAVNRKAISEAFTLTDTPGPQTLRMRIALTEAQASRPLMDITSTVMPYGVALSSLKRVAFGKHTAVGVARIEAEILDAETGQRLVAVVDARAGTKALKGKMHRWSDVKGAYDLWAERMRNWIVEAKNDE